MHKSATRFNLRAPSFTNFQGYAPRFSRKSMLHMPSVLCTLFAPNCIMKKSSNNVSPPSPPTFLASSTFGLEQESKCFLGVKLHKLLVGSPIHYSQ